MRLVVLEGPTARPTFEIHQQRTLIGRAPECDVLVYDAQVSRHHAQILRLGDAYVIESLQPANPAIVNDRVTVERRRLADGDLIVLGTVVLQVDLPPSTVQPDDQWARDHRMPGAPAPISDHLDPEDYQETPGIVMPEDIEPSSGAHATVLPDSPWPMSAQQPASAPSRQVEPPRQAEQAHTQPSLLPAAPRASAATPPSQTPSAGQAVSAASASLSAPSQSAPVDQRPTRAPSLPQRSPREQLRTVAARLGMAGQRLQAQKTAPGGGAVATSTESDSVSRLLAEHDQLGGDTELARLAELLSERLGNQTDIRALYRLGAEAAELGAWTRLAKQSIEEAVRLAEALGVHHAL